MSEQTAVMAEPDVPVPEPAPRAAAAALLLGFGILMVGNGLGGIVVGVRAELEGFDGTVTGLVMAAYFAGFLLGSRLSARLMGQVGHIRVFAALASVASTAALIHAVAIEPVVWVIARFLTGACMAGLYVVAESWLNDIATNATRGRLLAAYMIVTMMAMAAGQLLLDTADPTGLTLFVVASVLVSLSLVPISLSTTSAPPVLVPEAMSMRELIGLVPTGVVSIIGSGMTAGALMGLGAVYATREGLDPAAISRFVSAPMFGAICFQWPIGWLSDRVARRGLMVTISVSTVLIAGVLSTLDANSFAAIAAMFVLGGLMFPFYGLTIAFTNDWLPQSKMLAAGSSMVFLNGLGAIIGPLLGTIALASGVDGAFFYAVGAPSVLVSIYIGWRILVRDAVPIDEQRDWVPVSGRGTQVINTLARPLRRR